jgi:hydroxypyruvate reductase
LISKPQKFWHAFFINPAGFASIGGLPMDFESEARQIYSNAIKACLPERTLKEALKGFSRPAGKLRLVAIGKAAWRMSKAALDELGTNLQGIVVTKDGHSEGPLGQLEIYEAGHPVPDSRSYAATEKSIELAKSLGSDDMLLLLISGGGSSLFEAPLLSSKATEDITRIMLKSGIDINEMNTIRKRLSAVKGGKFAALCYPAKVCSFVLSDIPGNPLDQIASGPAYKDSTTAAQALEIAKKLGLPAEALELIKRELPIELDNVSTKVIGSVDSLLREAERQCQALGYKTLLLETYLGREAKELGYEFGAKAKTAVGAPLAIISGGEASVHVKGRGKGGRAQETALAAAIAMRGARNCAFFSIASDGTDGFTEAAGGFVDGRTYELMSQSGVDPEQHLENNDSYTALKAVGALLVTGPTGTNVNDLNVLLLRPED